MLYSLLLKELAVSELGDDFHRANLTVGQKNPCLKALSMIERHDECDSHMPLWMSRINWMPSSLDIHFIIMPLVPHWNKNSSMRWYCLDLCAVCSTLVLSSNGGWFSRNNLIRCIQSYVVAFSDSSITIRSCFIASFVGSIGFTKSLDNFSVMTSGGVGALEEAIHARWSVYTELQIHQKNYPSYTLLLDIRPSSHYCSCILPSLALLVAVNRPW
jgi:hypothetical protein